MKKMVYPGFEYNNRQVYFVKVLTGGYTKEFIVYLYIAPGIHFIIYLDKTELDKLQNDIKDKVYADYDLFRHDWFKVNDPDFYKKLYK
jgi:hypothetical protein